MDSVKRKTRGDGGGAGPYLFFVSFQKAGPIDIGLKYVRVFLFLFFYFLSLDGPGRAVLFF